MYFIMQNSRSLKVAFDLFYHEWINLQSLSLANIYHQPLIQTLFADATKIVIASNIKNLALTLLVV